MMLGRKHRLGGRNLAKLVSDKDVLPKLSPGNLLALDGVTIRTTGFPLPHRPNSPVAFILQISRAIEMVTIGTRAATASETTRRVHSVDISLAAVGGVECESV